jgi:hypothetical protein
MRRSGMLFVQQVVVALGVLLFAGTGSVLAQDLTEETYGPMMGEVRLLVGDVSQHIDNRYWPELGEDLDKLFPVFRRMEAFWTARGNDGAVELVGNGIAALREIGQAGIAMEVPPAQAGLANLRAVCGSCHEAHREADGDGFKIKAGS